MYLELNFADNMLLQPELVVIVALFVKVPIYFPTVGKMYLLT